MGANRIGRPPAKVIHSKRHFFALLWVLAGAAVCSAADSSKDGDKIRIVLVGDSTVTDKAGWGGAFEKLLVDEVKCFNEAQGGRSSKSFRDEGHWKRALEHKPAWVLIQFGHNDQPGKGPERETDPKSTFAANLSRYVDDARAIGAKPVLITSLTRRNFEDGKLVRDLAEFVAATRSVAEAKKVPLVDLNARSIEQAEKLGPLGVEPMEPWGKPAWTKDHTHLNKHGARLVAPLVVEELRKVAPDFAKFFRGDR